MKKENEAIIKGTIIENPELFSVSMADEYYMIKVEVKRLSKVIDVVPVVMPRKSIDPTADYRGMRIYVSGSLQTIRKETHLVMYIYAKNADIYFQLNDEEDLNEIKFWGIMKNKNVRETSKRKIPIAEVYFLNWKYYFPCIAWNENAKKVEDTEINVPMLISGRFQSRVYDSTEGKTAMEISIQELNIV